MDKSPKSSELSGNHIRVVRKLDCACADETPASSDQVLTFKSIDPCQWSGRNPKSTCAGEQPCVSHPRHLKHGVCENADAMPCKGRFQCMPWQLRRVGGENQMLESSNLQLSDSDKLCAV